MWKEEMTRGGFHWEKMENISDKEKKKSGYVSKQWRKQGRMGRQQKGDWRKSHGKIRIRQREEKEKRAT